MWIYVSSWAFFVRTYEYKLVDQYDFAFTYSMHLAVLSKLAYKMKINIKTTQNLSSFRVLISIWILSLNTAST